MSVSALVAVGAGTGSSHTGTSYGSELNLDTHHQDSLTLVITVQSWEDGGSDQHQINLFQAASLHSKPQRVLDSGGHWIFDSGGGRRWHRIFRATLLRSVADAGREINAEQSCESRTNTVPETATWVPKQPTATTHLSWFASWIASWNLASTDLSWITSRVAS